MLKDTPKKELTDKQRVQKLCKDAKLSPLKSKTYFVMSGKKSIASGKTQLGAWKNALHSLL